MTVKELIVLLEQHDPDDEVFLEVDDTSAELVYVTDENDGEKSVVVLADRDWTE